MPRKNIAIAVFPALLFVFLLSLFFLLSPQFQSNAQEDGSPPVLVDFALSTNEVDSDTEGEVTVYVRVSDDSGISSISGILRPMAYDDDTNWETQQLSLDFSLALDCSGLSETINLDDLIDCGDEYEGIYSATIAFPLGSTLGEWKVQELFIGAENGDVGFGFTDLETLYGVGSATIDNVGVVEDTEGPEILDYSFDQTDIDTSLADEELVLTVRVSDDISGIPDQVSLYFSPYIAFNLELQVGECLAIDEDIDVSGLTGCGDKNDGIYVGTSTLPRWSASGDWIVENMFADNLGNIGTLPASPVLFTNNAEIEDITSPTITSLVVDKTRFDTSSGDQTITFTMELEDSVSGVDMSQYQSYIGLRPVFAWDTNIMSGDLELISGDIYNGTFKAEITIPAGSTPGFWTFIDGMIVDNAGNGVSVEVSTYLDEIYIANTALSNEVTIGNRWWLEGEQVVSVSYDGATKVNSLWPSVVIIFQEDTVVTKQGGGDFGIHRMVSESYMSEKYSTLGALLNEANSELTSDIAECDASEGCVANQLNDNDLVGNPLNIGKVGVPGLGLSFSKPVTIILAVDSQYLGQTLIVQTFDGSKWVEQGSCLVQTYAPMDPGQGGNEEEWNILVSYPGCSFTTDHASFFSANVLGVETEELPGVPRTGLGGTDSGLERYVAWLR